MDQTETITPKQLHFKLAIQSSNLLNGTSADLRYLTSEEYTAVGSSFDFEILPPAEEIVADSDSAVETDWEKDYTPLLMRSPIVEELKRQSA